MSKERFQLDAEVREILGKKVKQLRNQGLVPAVVYGRDFENVNITVDAKTLHHVLSQAGGSQLIELNIGDHAVPTLARDVQRDPIKGEILHVDFYRVAMDRLIRTTVPVVLVGEAPAVERSGAIMHQSLTGIEIEALPGDLPPHLDVDITGLAEVGQHVVAGDLVLPGGVRLVSDPSEVIARIDLLAEEPVEEEPVLEEASAEPELVRRRAEEEEGEE